MGAGALTAARGLGSAARRLPRRRCSRPARPGSFSFGPGGADGEPRNLPLAAGQTFGKGPVRVALLLPLSGDPGLATVGISMANAAELAIDFIETNPNIADNITVVLKDTGTTPAARRRPRAQARAAKARA